jgi:hypothetical protein
MNRNAMVLVLTAALAACGAERTTDEIAESDAETFVVEAEIDSQAVDVAREAVEFLASQERFHLRSRMTHEVEQESGQFLWFSETREVTVRRPNKLFAVGTRDDGRVRHAWYDGETFTIYDQGENAYGQVPIGDDLDAMFDYLETVLEMPIPMADLLYNDLTHLNIEILSATYIGVSRVEGVECDHLAFRNEAVDWQMWIERGDSPWVRKFAINYRELPGTPQFAAVLDEWDAAPTTPDELFEFMPPEDAVQIEVSVPAPIETDIEEGGEG